MGLLGDLSKLVASRKPPPVYEPDAPSREAYEAAMALVEALRKDRDHWCVEAAMKEREVRDLRAERDRAWADVETSSRTIANLEARVDLLALDNAELRDEVDRLSGKRAPAKGVLEGSWSGFVEGG